MLFTVTTYLSKACLKFLDVVIHCALTSGDTKATCKVEQALRNINIYGTLWKIARMNNTKNCFKRLESKKNIYIYILCNDILFKHDMNCTALTHLYWHSAGEWEHLLQMAECPCPLMPQRPQSPPSPAGHTVPQRPLEPRAQDKRGREWDNNENA